MAENEYFLSVKDLEVIYTSAGKIIHAVNARDYPVVRTCVLFFAMFTAVVMLIIDLIYAMLAPRIKARYQGKH